MANTGTEIHLRKVDVSITRMGKPGQTVCKIDLGDVEGRYTLDVFEATCDTCRMEYLAQRMPKPTDPVKVHITVELPNDLTMEQFRRVNDKMYIVAEIAQRAASAMVKGTLKYDTDHHTLAEWIEYGLDDSMDAAVYPYFIRDTQWHG